MFEKLIIDTSPSDNIRPGPESQDRRMELSFHFGRYRMPERGQVDLDPSIINSVSVTMSLRSRFPNPSEGRAD